MADTDERTTPDWLFKKLDAIFDFRLDPAATAQNAKCGKFFTKKTNGLVQDWLPWKSVFVNPPYSRGSLLPWLTKCADEGDKGATVVAVVPGDHSTKWAKILRERATVRLFLTGRIAFDVYTAGTKGVGTTIAVFGLCALTQVDALRAAFDGEVLVSVDIRAKKTWMSAELAHWLILGSDGVLNETPSEPHTFRMLQ
jgi:phage N-6-adenine-methyltransferase